MANPSKAKGTSFETALVDFLKPMFPAVERRALHGNTDKGDIAGIPDWTFEAKNRKKLGIGGALDEAITEARNAGTPYAVAIVKRPRKGDVAQAFAIMTTAQLASIIFALRYREVR